MTARRDTSAASAARFRRLRGVADERDGRSRRNAMRRMPASAPLPRRITCDFAEPTLRLIHEVLLDAIHAGIDFSDRGALLLIAEQMVATALGDPPCDDPPLTDREVG